MLPLQLTDNQDHAIREYSRRAFPNECCGFLLGRDDSDARNIKRVVPAVNDREDEELHNRFTISPRAFMLADKEARAAGLDILGFYHSHPDAPARPSQYDLDHAWPVYSYVIVSVEKGTPAKMTCWVLEDDRSGFNEQSIAISQSQLEEKEDSDVD